MNKNLVQQVALSQIRHDLPEFETGDTVRVMETRPLSKDKRWRLVEIIERAK